MRLGREWEMSEFYLTAYSLFGHFNNKHYYSFMIRLPNMLLKILIDDDK